MGKFKLGKMYVVDTEGRVWRRSAIPEGVTLAKGYNREKIEQENREAIARRKELERIAKEKARQKAQIEREKARKEWEERPRIIYTPMGNKR